MAGWAAARSRNHAVRGEKPPARSAKKIVQQNGRWLLGSPKWLRRGGGRDGFASGTLLARAG